MKLIEIDGRYFNPKHVAAVSPDPRGAVITLAAGANTKSGVRFTVNVEVATVISLLEAK